MRKLSFILFIISLNTFAQAVPTEIQDIKGQVLYYRAKTLSVLTPRTELENDDLIMTKNGRVALLFEDTTLTLSPHSLFRIVNLKNKERHQFGEFLMGEFSSVTRKKLVDKRRLEVLLPKSKVHVIGTRFIVQIASTVEKLLERQKGDFSKIPRLELIPEVVSNNDLVTQITCFEGKVFVTTDSGQAKELEQKESALYSGSGANLRVTIKDQDDLDSMAQGLGFQISETSTNDSSPVE